MDTAISVITEPAVTRLEAIIASATVDGLVQIAKKVKHKKKKICGTGYPIGSVLSPTLQHFIEKSMFLLSGMFNKYPGCFIRYIFI